MKRSNSIECIILLTAVMAFLAVPVWGNSIVGIHDWDTGTHGWSSRDGWVLTNRETAGGNPDGWLSITFTNLSSGAPGPHWFDTVSTSATNLFAGTWSTTNWIEFDFWASNREPREVQVRFSSTNDPNRIWRSTVFDTETDSLSLETWTPFTASFSNWEDWRVFSPGYTEANYLADLDQIDWIGVYIYRTTRFDQVYGIDNFALMIPEPVEVCMVVAAMISSTMSLRKKRRRKRSPG